MQSLARVLIGVTINDEDHGDEASMHIDDTAPAGPSGGNPPEGG
jgi:hypothetical protein